MTRQKLRGIHSHTHMTKWIKLIPPKRLAHLILRQAESVISGKSLFQLCDISNLRKLCSWSLKWLYPEELIFICAWTYTETTAAFISLAYRLIYHRVFTLALLGVKLIKAAWKYFGSLCLALIILSNSVHIILLLSLDSFFSHSEIRFCCQELFLREPGKILIACHLEHNCVRSF